MPYIVLGYRLLLVCKAYRKSTWTVRGSIFDISVDGGEADFCFFLSTHKKVKGKGHTLDIAPLSKGTSLQRR